MIIPFRSNSTGGETVILIDVAKEVVDSLDVEDAGAVGKKSDVSEKHKLAGAFLEFWLGQMGDQHFQSPK